jgi:hypothetical protein
VALGSPFPLLILPVSPDFQIEVRIQPTPCFEAGVWALFLITHPDKMKHFRNFIQTSTPGNPYSDAIQSLKIDLSFFHSRLKPEIMDFPGDLAFQEIPAPAKTH